MIKTNHFNFQGNFSPMMYLADIAGGENLKYESFNVVNDVKDQILNDEFIKSNKLLSVGKKIILNSEVVIEYFDSYGNDTICVSFLESFDIEAFKILISKYLYVKGESDLPKIHLIAIEDSMPTLIQCDLKARVTIDLENSYNMSSSFEDVNTIINSGKSGLILFTGDPGTGKTTLIKYLSQMNQQTKFCFISNSNIDILSNPSFVHFCLNELRDSIVILEDCENALLSRDMNKGFDISNILNITDGLLGDMLNLKIIATLNTHDKIDHALLRKGRLLSKVAFNPLKPEQATNLSKSLGKGIEFTKEVCLCEVYNTEPNAPKEKKSTIGFSL